MTTHGDKDEWFDGEVKPPHAPADAEVGADDGADEVIGPIPAASENTESGADDKALPEPIFGFGPDIEAELIEDLERAFDGATHQHHEGGAVDFERERDEYREALLRMKADFENYKKRIAKDHAAMVDRATEKLILELLPVIDACEAAIGHGLDDVEPIYKSLVESLEKGGLERIVPDGQTFDPNLHEAVMHEPGDDDEHTVIETLRTGYVWNGHVLRPAMVKVRG